MKDPLRKAVRLVEKNINRARKRWVVNLMVEPELIEITKANARASNLPIHSYVRRVLKDAAAAERRFILTPAGK